MSMKATVELTRGELGLLWMAAQNSMVEFHKLVEQGRWHDRKERDKVTEYLDHYRALFVKIDNVIKEMDA